MSDTLCTSSAITELIKPFSVFLEDSTITEISMCRYGEIWVRQYDGWHKHDVSTLTPSYMDALIRAIATYNGLAIAPYMDVILPQGERGSIISYPAVLHGTLGFVIRKHMPTTKTIDALCEEGLFSHTKFIKARTSCGEQLRDHHSTPSSHQDYSDLLTSAVIDKKNIVIAGKTGSGKTTLARSLIDSVPTTERIITIEDVHELSLPHHPNRLHMLFGRTKGRLSANQCLTSAMRLSPDRIFLAEIRGNEAWEYINSLNTGHPGSVSTVHANNALHAYDRIASLVKQSDVGQSLDIDFIRDTLFRTIHIMIYMENRRIMEIYDSTQHIQ